MGRGAGWKRDQGRPGDQPQRAERPKRAEQRAPTGEFPNDFDRQSPILPRFVWSDRTASYCVDKIDES